MDTHLYKGSKIINEVYKRSAKSIAEKWENPAELKMTTRDWKKHDAAHKCYICDRFLHEVKYNKVKYYDNGTQKFNGAAHQGCVKTMCEARRLDYKKSLYCTEKLSIGEEKTFKEATKCFICKGSLKEEQTNKVKDHDHITGQFRESAHR